MACVTLTPDIQGCLNIPLIRGDDKTFTLTFSDELGAPIDLSLYTIRMAIRQGGGYSSPVSEKTLGDGLTVAGNVLTVSFAEDDAVYQRDYKALFYDIAFTRIADGWVEHWIKGQIVITKSETWTWK